LFMLVTSRSRCGWRNATSVDKADRFASTNGRPHRKASPRARRNVIGISRKTKSCRISVAKPMQKLTRLDIEAWHNAPHQTKAARTIGHAHRVLHKALGDAEADNLVAKNVCRSKKAPKPAEGEMVIVHDVPDFIAKICSSRLYIQALVAIVTGMRLGKVLALRDRYLDLDKKMIYFREALEETQAHGMRVKPPKTKARSPGHLTAGYCRPGPERAPPPVA
jgi:integrase